MQLSRQTQGYLGVLMGVGAGSFTAIIIRLVQEAGIGSIAVAAGRLGIAALVLAPFALRMGRAEISVLSRRNWVLILTAGLLLAAHFASFISSLEYTSVLSALVFGATTPFFTALIAWFTLGERPLTGVWIGILLAIIGTLIVALGGNAGNPPTRPAPLLGNTLALMAAIFIAAYFTAGREVRDRLNVVTYSMLVFGSASIWLLFLLPLFGHSLLGHSPAAYGWLLLLAFEGQLISHGGWNLALGGFPATVVSLYLLVIPVTSSLVAALILAEIPTVLAVTGGVVILCGVGVAIISRRRR